MSRISAPWRVRQRGRPRLPHRHSGRSARAPGTDLLRRTTKTAATVKTPRKMRTTKTSVETMETTRDGARGIRLQKFLAEAGIASRREGERLIQAGRVEVNGRTSTLLGVRVDPERDQVRVDGRRVRVAGLRVYYLLNKPKGVITSSSDPQGRPTVIELLQGVRERIFPVGRLDWNSEGLLILTNDGELAYRLTHPSNHVAKVSRVKVKGTVGDRD